MTGNKHLAATGVDHFFHPPIRSVSRCVSAFAAIAVLLVLVGCAEEKPTTDPLMGAIVYVDLKTQQPMVELATTELPTMNPQTGQRTLMPGLYCPHCQRWHPVPAFDKLQRIPGAATCPTDGTPLTTDGPWPQGDN